MRRKKKQEEDRESDGIIREENVKGKEVMEKVNEREESKKKEKKDYRVSLWLYGYVVWFNKGKKWRGKKITEIFSNPHCVDYQVVLMDSYGVHNLVYTMFPLASKAGMSNGVKDDIHEKNDCSNKKWINN